MERYEFRVRIIEQDANYFLEIRPIVRFFKGKPITSSPFSFSVLNVLIQTNSPSTYRENHDVDYFLDFENSFDGNLEHRPYLNRDKQMKILSVLESKVDRDIEEVLKGNKKLLEKEKTIRFKADNVFVLYKAKRCGSPKKGKGFSYGVYKKPLSD